MVAGCTGYRLPTEAQWEYAARATTTTAWAYFQSYDTSADPGQVTGSGFNSNLDAMGWYAFNETTQYPGGTNPEPENRETNGGCLICTAMCRNGVRIVCYVPWRRYRSPRARYRLRTCDSRRWLGHQRWEHTVGVP